jgi:hypothetical protein
MTSRFAGAARRMSGQFAEAARELSWRARYTRTPGGLWTRRQWHVGWDNVVHPGAWRRWKPKTGCGTGRSARLSPSRRSSGERKNRLNGTGVTECRWGGTRDFSWGPAAIQEPVLPQRNVRHGTQNQLSPTFSA